MSPWAFDASLLREIPGPNINFVLGDIPMAELWRHRISAPPKPAIRRLTDPDPETSQWTAHSYPITILCNVSFSVSSQADAHLLVHVCACGHRQRDPRRFSGKCRLLRLPDRWLGPRGRDKCPGCLRIEDISLLTCNRGSSGTGLAGRCA